MKINLEKPIVNIRGLPIENEVVNPKTKKIEKKIMRVRDYLLTILGTRFEMEDRQKEPFWTTELGILIADEQKKEIEISEPKANFLKRILENNKVKQVLPMGGEKEIELFFPFELGQLLQLFEETGRGEEDSEVEKLKREVAELKKKKLWTTEPEKNCGERSSGKTLERRRTF